MDFLIKNKLQGKLEKCNEENFKNTNKSIKEKNPNPVNQNTTEHREWQKNS